MGESEHSSGSGSHLPPSNVTAILTRTIIAIIRSSGNPDAADWIANAPEKIGGALGSALARLFQKRERGVPVTRADLRELATAAQKEPRAAKELVVSGPPSIHKPVRKSLALPSLEPEAAALEEICQAMKRDRTSFALRGFLQKPLLGDKPDCISYWQATGPNPTMFLGMLLDLDIYLLRADPTDTLLDALNEIIRDSPNRQLPPDLIAYDRLPLVSRVKQITLSEVAVEEIDIQAWSKRGKATSGPGRIIPMKYPRDVLHFYAIVKPPDVILKESLAVALRVQKRATPVAPANKQAVRELKRWLSGSPGVLPLP